MREKMALLKMDDVVRHPLPERRLLRRREEARRDPADGAARARALAVLDETDSGLDIDALRVVSEGVNALIEPRHGRCC